MHSYQDKYLALYESSAPDYNRAEYIYDYITKIAPASLFDVGSGWGELVNWARDNGIKAEGLDFASPVADYKQRATEPFPIDEVDMVVSLDFFEHLFEHEIDTVLDEIKRVCKGVFIASISSHDSRGTFLDGSNLHNTIYPQSWWIDRIQSRGFKRKATFKNHELFQVFDA